MIGAGRKLRQVLAELDARNLRRDRLELATDPDRRVGFHIERIEMAQTAGQEDQ